jgi:hypothetical protein
MTALGVPGYAGLSVRRAPLLLAGLLVVAVAGSSLIHTEDVAAQPKKAAAKGKKPAKGKKGEEEPAAEAADAGAAEGEKEMKGTEETGKSVAKDPKTNSSGGPSVVETKGTDGGVKTYKFGPVEVEGRLKSPQVVYFMRRVRAEFAAGALGHRSFLPELSDTRRNPAIK